MLANIFLHYKPDLWLDRKWRKREARGELHVIRYADNFVIATQCRGDAQAMFEQSGLRTESAKTRMIECGLRAAARRRKRGQGRPETFDCPGFTRYSREKRNGRCESGRKPVAKRMRRTLQALRATLRRRMHRDAYGTGRWPGRCSGDGSHDTPCRPARRVSGRSCAK